MMLQSLGNKMRLNCYIERQYKDIYLMAIEFYLCLMKSIAHEVLKIHKIFWHWWTPGIFLWETLLCANIMFL